MRAFRLCKRRYRAFDGEGARLFGSRWTVPGIPVVYTAATLSLAALELLVHMDAEDAIMDLVSLEVTIPEDVRIETIAAEALPPDWRDTPAPARLQGLGTRWAEAARTAVLVVPSAVVPTENNVVINPRHTEFQRIQVGPPQKFEFDPRLRRT